jgi:MFS family permease
VHSFHHSGEAESFRRQSAAGHLGGTSYAAALRASGVAWPFAASLLGRLPMGAVGLVFILRTEQLTGSYAAGGLAAGVYALALGVTAPMLGRVIDRRGQTAVLLGGAIVQAAALVAFALLPDGTGSGPILALAVLAGAAQPPLGSSLRTLWSELHDPAVRHTVFAMDSAVLEAVYIAGPVMIVAGIGGTVSIPAAALVCAVFGLTGTLAFALTRSSRAWRPPAARAAGRAGALGATGIRTLLGALCLVGASIATVEVAVPALCERAGADGATGLVLGVWGLGSLIGGVIAGRRAAAKDAGVRFAWLLAALALGTLPLALASDVAGLAALIFVAGIAIAPSLAAAQGLAGLLAPAGTVTEAYTWLGTGISAGIALGGAAGGAIVESAGPSTAFVVAAVAVAGAAAVAAAGRSTLRPA